MDQMKIGAFLKKLRKEKFNARTACRTTQCFWKNSITMGNWYKYAGHKHFG